MKYVLAKLIFVLSFILVSSANAQSVSTSSKRLSYDVSGDSIIDYNDTVMIIRHLFGFSGLAITSGLTLSADSLRSSPEAIGAYLVSLSASGALDVDGNGRSDALSDGLLIARYYSGMRRAKLITGVIDPAGIRTTDQAVIRYMRSWDF